MVEEPGGKSAKPRRVEKPEGEPPDEIRGAIPELVRRALTMGLSGFFFTEATIRKALGDALPKDWIDFAVDQSDRTRAEFLERLSYEIGRALENVDVAAVLRELLEGRTLEVKAEIRLGERDGRPGSQSSVRVVRSGGVETP